MEKEIEKNEEPPLLLSTEKTLGQHSRGAIPLWYVTPCPTNAGETLGYLHVRFHFFDA